MRGGIKLPGMNLRSAAVVCCSLAGLFVLGGCAASTSPPASRLPEQPLTPRVSRRVLDAPLPTFLFPQNDGGRWTVPPGSALITVNHLFGATFGAVTSDYKLSLSPAGAGPLQNVQLSRGGMRLAYLAMPGIDPGEDYIEIVDLSAAKAQIVRPAKGFAIFGFALEPGGNNLVFSEAALAGSSSRQVPWDLLAASLQSGQIQLVLSSDKVPGLEETVPVPIAWSRSTGEVYVNAIRPFRGGGGRGIWAVHPDGSGLRQVLSEDKFVGTPRLSPDGSRLAYLASEPESLPPGFIAGFGEPPGNVVLVNDLTTGQERIVVQEKGRAIGIVAWAGDANSLLISRRDWVDTGLQDTDIAALDLKGSTERQLQALPQGSSITDVFEETQGALLWVNISPTVADLLYRDGSGAPTSILTIRQGQINIVGRVD